MSFPHAITEGVLGGCDEGARITWCEQGSIMRWAAHNAILGFISQEGDGNWNSTLRVTDPNNETLRVVMSLTLFFGLKLLGVDILPDN